MNILLGVTGSVAATLTPKLALALAGLTNGTYQLKIVVTDAAKPFLPTLREHDYRPEHESFGAVGRHWLKVAKK